MIAEKLTSFFLGIIKQALTESLSQDIDDLKGIVLTMQNMVLKREIDATKERLHMEQRLDHIERILFAKLHIS